MKQESSDKGIAGHGSLLMRVAAMAGYGEEGSSSSGINFSEIDLFAESERALGFSRYANTPDRFTFFHLEDDDSVRSADILSLVCPGQTFRELFRGGQGNWWLDVACPSDAEIRMLAKAFGIHPVTAEDIRMQEPREKFEQFKNYYTIYLHLFEADREAENYLEPVHMYMVVFKEGLLTFHSAPLAHPAKVRRRVRSLGDYLNVTSDWLCYALLDDIIESFDPELKGVERECAMVEEGVLTAQEMHFSGMLMEIGDARRRTMDLSRLLCGKLLVVQMFCKRCEQLDLREIALFLSDITDHIGSMTRNLAAFDRAFSKAHGNFLAQLQVESFNANLRVTEILSNVTILGLLFLPMNCVTTAFSMNVKVPGQDGPHLGWFFGIIGSVGLFIASMYWGVGFFLRRHDKYLMKMEDDKRSLHLTMANNKRVPQSTKSIFSVPRGY